MHLHLAFVGLAALALAACEQCPTCPQLPLAGGTFATSTPGGPGNGTPSGTFPWNSEPKTIDVDVPQRVVHLRYVRDGHQIVETYRIASLTECPQ